MAQGLVPKALRMTAAPAEGRQPICSPRRGEARATTYIVKDTGVTGMISQVKSEGHIGSMALQDLMDLCGVASAATTGMMHMPNPMNPAGIIHHGMVGLRIRVPSDTQRLIQWRR